MSSILWLTCLFIGFSKGEKRWIGKYDTKHRPVISINRDDGRTLLPIRWRRLTTCQYTRWTWGLRSLSSPPNPSHSSLWPRHGDNLTRPNTEDMTQISNGFLARGFERILLIIYLLRTSMVIRRPTYRAQAPLPNPAIRWEPQELRGRGRIG